MDSDQADALIYCRHILLPIWERWTDGDLSVRHALGCGVSDLGVHLEAQTRALAAVERLMAFDATLTSAAAVAAGFACLAALQGELGAFHAFADEACAAHALAEREQRPRVAEQVE